MKVLLTGASGFIGRALTRRLLADGMEVRGTGRGSSAANEAIEWRQLSSPDAAAWREAVAGCDCIVHLAGLAHQSVVRGPRTQPSPFWRVNVELTRTVAEQAVAAAVGRVIFVSSVGAVCAQSAEAIDETTPCRPADEYGRSKLAAEQILQAQLAASTVDWCILRPPLIYGPGNPGNMARLQRLIRSGLPLPFGAIRNRRSFMFIDNLVDALVTVVSYPGRIGSIYLVSDGSDFGTPQLVRSLALGCGARVRMVSVPVVALKLLGYLGGRLSTVLRGSAAFDSRSIERLTQSLLVNSSKFRSAFSWRPPVEPGTALALTCNTRELASK